MKQCRKCREPFEGSRCSDCHKSWLRAKYAADPAQFKARAEAYRARNHDKVRIAKRLALFVYRYGKTLAELEAMRVAQGNRCLVCHGEMTEKLGGRRWVVDHYNRPDGSPVVRGLLHHRCNVGLGMLGDHDAVSMERAAGYIRRQGTPTHPAEPPPMGLSAALLF